MIVELLKTKIFRLPLWTIALATGGLAWLLFSRKQKEIKQDTVVTATNVVSRKERKSKRRKLKIFYGSQTGNAKKFATKLANDVLSRGYNTAVVDLKDYDPEDDLSEEVEYVCVFIIATYTDGTPPKDASWFYKWLEETASDFRVQKILLKGLHYAVFGLGNSFYKDNYNKVAINVDQWLRDLTAIRVHSLGLGDENVTSSQNGGLEEDFLAWKAKFVKFAKPVLDGRTVKKCVGEKCDGKCACAKTKKGEGDGEVADGAGCDSDEDEILFETDSESETASKPTGHAIVDLEDLGKIIKKTKKKVQEEDEDGADQDGAMGDPREMITPVLRQSLEKQGYKLIGSHSGVKLCRWTKVPYDCCDDNTLYNGVWSFTVIDHTSFQKVAYGLQIRYEELRTRYLDAAATSSSTT